MRRRIPCTHNQSCANFIDPLTQPTPTPTPPFPRAVVCAQLLHVLLCSLAFSLLSVVAFLGRADENCGDLARVISLVAMSVSSLTSTLCRLCFRIANVRSSRHLSHVYYANKKRRLAAKLPPGQATSMMQEEASRSDGSGAERGGWEGDQQWRALGFKGSVASTPSPPPSPPVAPPPLYTSIAEVSVDLGGESDAGVQSPAPPPKLIGGHRMPPAHSQSPSRGREMEQGDLVRDMLLERTLQLARAADRKPLATMGGRAAGGKAAGGTPGGSTTPCSNNSVGKKPVGKKPVGKKLVGKKPAGKPSASRARVGAAESSSGTAQTTPHDGVLRLATSRLLSIDPAGGVEVGFMLRTPTETTHGGVFVPAEHVGGTLSSSLITIHYPRAALPPGASPPTVSEVVRPLTSKGYHARGGSVLGWGAADAAAWVVNLTLLLGASISTLAAFQARDNLPLQLQAGSMSYAQWTTAVVRAFSFSLLQSLLVVDLLKVICLTATSEPLLVRIGLHKKSGRRLAKPIRRLHKLMDLLL